MSTEGDRRKRALEWAQQGAEHEPEDGIFAGVPLPPIGPYECRACISAGIDTCDHTCADCDVDGKHDSPDCPTKVAIQNAILAVTCPTCHAEPGAPCIGIISRFHFKRHAAAFPPRTDMGRAAIDELRQIKSYLAHYDQDANHAWMVRRIDAVLTGKDPSKVIGWHPDDAVRPPRIQARQRIINELDAATRAVEEDDTAALGESLMTIRAIVSAAVHNMPTEDQTLDAFCAALGWSRVPVEDALAEVKALRAKKLDAAELDTLEDVFDFYTDDDAINAHLTDDARRLYAKLTK